MGYSPSSCTDSLDPLHNSSNTQTLTSNADHYELKLKSLIYKMIWDLGLACIIPPRRRRIAIKNQNEDKNGKNSVHLEHNKAWLLAEAGGCGGPELSNADPHSAHSSFRFTLCTQVEVDQSMNVNHGCTSNSATVLMVNLDSGLTDPKLKEMKWRKVESLERNISPVVNSLIRFSYNEIASATRNFSKGRVLGRGALSYVFRGRVGFLRTTVAIKRLDMEDEESPKAFCRELMIASSLHNPYIVPLVGFCIDPEEGLFLVYKYVSGGSLERYLHGKKRGGKGGPALTWCARYKVAVGIAESIGYLHNGTERCVVHRDIKPSNILLSSKKTPKLCDFGLATWTPAPSVPFLCKTVKGTFGYLAPEYFQHGKVSDKTDVYAFGVVLLELLTGRKPIETKRGPGEENLVLWAKPLLQQDVLEKVLDTRLKFPRKNLHQISRMVQAAAACIHSEESRRPDIDEIIDMLRGRESDSINRNNNILPSNSCMIDYNQLQQTRSEMKSHLALAMLGVTEFDDDDLYRC
ncbi:probable serine/threonine-protein kinase PBL7 [Lycium barbarum]|uniref:probable serine/threonine-protein kinase PBL7 n=1 Tax=Lycium barbarum TaxID=112863 RepID=UPI00293EB06D|nr:probable serine/threonine-protein kinase PBL7 [Lycium barbarum]